MIEIKNHLTNEVLHTLGVPGSNDKDLSQLLLYNADLRGMDLSETNFTNCTLIGALLNDANLSGTNFTQATMYTANLSGANATDANFTNATLSEVNFTNAKVPGATFTGAVLIGTTFKKTNLNEANLRGIKEDLFLVFESTKKEVKGLLSILQEGRIDGQVYEGKCACLIGTIANLRECSFREVGSLAPCAQRPIERWFLGIKIGDTPDLSPIAKITEGWIKEWIAQKL